MTLRGAGFAWILVSATATSAQTLDTGGTPPVGDLAAPVTPAVALLGITPTSVERPDNPKALIVNIASELASGEGVPRNFGMAITPYWLRSHPRLTFQSYANPALGARVARTFSLSVASSDWRVGQGRSSADAGSRVALGVGVVPLQGRMSERVLEAARELSDTLDEYADAVKEREDSPGLRSLRAYRKQLAAAFEAAAADPSAPAVIVGAQLALADADAAIEALAAAHDAAITRLDNRRLRLAREIGTLDTRRSGVRMAVAAASSWTVPDDVLRNMRLDRAAVWVNPSYRFGVRPDDALASLELVGVARYLRQVAAPETPVSHGWDAGGRVVWLLQPEIAVSAEVVRRLWRSGDRPSTFRAAAAFEARVGAGAYLFATFGRDFDDRDMASTLLSVVGINIGLGRAPELTY